MAEYSKSSKATSNDLWGHETASGGKSRALRLREEEEAKGVKKVKHAGQQAQWMPRAIKKQERQVDGSLSKLQKQFNVDKSEAPAPPVVVKTEASSSVAAAKGSASSSSSSWRMPHDKASTSTTSFNGAADLDELADEDEKKPKIEESQRPKLEPVPTRAPVDPNRDQVVEGAPRLAQHIRTSSKFIKVAGMAYALLEGKQVTEKNAGAFFEVLAAGTEGPSPSPG